MPVVWPGRVGDDFPYADLSVKTPKIFQCQYRNQTRRVRDIPETFGRAWSDPVRALGYTSDNL